MCVWLAFGNQQHCVHNVHWRSWKVPNQIYKNSFEVSKIIWPKSDPRFVPSSCFTKKKTSVLAQQRYTYIHKTTKSEYFCQRQIGLRIHTVMKVDGPTPKRWRFDTICKGLWNPPIHGSEWPSTSRASFFHRSTTNQPIATWTKVAWTNFASILFGKAMRWNAHVAVRDLGECVVKFCHKMDVEVPE